MLMYQKGKFLRALAIKNIYGKGTVKIDYVGVNINEARDARPRWLHWAFFFDFTPGHYTEKKNVLFTVDSKSLE